MAKPSKLDIIWAESGVSVDPGDAKFNLGWVAEIPPYQHFNYVLNKHSVMLDHVNVKGIPIWDALTTYGLGSRVLHKGVLYKCKVATDQGTEPLPANSGVWYNSDVESDVPVGTVMLFDANTPVDIDGIPVTVGSAGSWVDNVTIPGWYACVDGNQSRGCPNLVAKFIMGKVLTGAGSVSGSNTHTLSVAEMPIHSHGHSMVGAGGHTHTITVDTKNVTTSTDTHDHNLPRGANVAGPNYALNDLYNRIANVSGYAQPGTDNDTHSHTANHNHTASASSVSNHSHGLTIDNEGSGNAFDKKPANYSIIYIRKCE